MPLSRLDNFLKNARGNTLYVNPNDLDATDSIENQGNSLARPFRTIQRALVEAARFSYQSGLDNDRFSKTTILLYPGDHVVDNRPGWIPNGSNSFRLRDGSVSSNMPQWDLTTSFDLNNEDNALYKMNSVHGGIILPRGTSIVGLDLRKTKIRPKYVPNPENDNIERSAIFRVTGTCYLWQFTILDADPNDVAYKDYTTNLFVPNFSHHKLTAFEYADGVNNVTINDIYNPTLGDLGRTDLDMYYEKIGIVYGPSSGREIQPDYPSSLLDIQPKVDEYRIVGPTGGSVGITSIRAGNGVVSSETITVDLEQELSGLSVDTAFQISNVSATGYNGQFVVTEVLSPTQIQYRVSAAPTNPLPTITGSTIQLNVDTVTSASPYIFNISLRSVFGMCGMHADGSKASGFKSMVVAQFTGIGLQKDKNAFVKYNSSDGEYKDVSFAGNENINTDSLAIFKPSYRNYHIKASNNSFIQCVSIFAIGYAEHFVAESGGDQSITNSNSNFGAKSLVATGFRDEAFARDDVGYISHIIPPREIETPEVSIEFGAIDVLRTVGIASTSRLYLYNQTNSDISPDSVIEGYRIGAKHNDRLNVLISESGITTQYSARIIMPNTGIGQTQITGEKGYTVGRSSGINSITANTVTFTQNHSFIEGESIRIIAEDGNLPDGLESNRIYYAITSGVSANQIQIAQTSNKAFEGEPTTINDRGGILHISSRVSDKVSGEIGHPIQFDSNTYTLNGNPGQVGGWYINVGTATTDNDLYPTLVSLGTTALGEATPRTFITRTPDTRNIIDTVYRARYVIPAGTGITSARPPIDGYVIQSSSSNIGITTTEVEKYFAETPATLSNENELRNFQIIADARWNGSVSYITTELPHNLKVGAKVKLSNIKSSNNAVGTANSGYNGEFIVTGISSAKEFTVTTTSSNPGTFENNTSDRSPNLPFFTEKETPGIYQIYRSQEVQKYIPGQQTGIYQLLLFNSSNSPSISPFSTEKYSQNIQNLYPQTNRDNPESDPKEAASFALPDPIGRVVTNDLRLSITKETLQAQLSDYNVGIAITSIASNSAGTAHTIYTNVDHGLNRVTAVSIANSGAAYGSGSADYFYNARLVGIGTTVGRNATARVYINAAGNLDDVTIMDGGSAFSIGDQLAVVGIATTTGHVVGFVTVTALYNNIGDIVTLNRVTPNSNDQYNTSYRITGIGTGNDRQIEVTSIDTIGIGETTVLVGSAVSTANLTLTGNSLFVSSLTYDNTIGIATIVTNQAHGFRVDNKVRIFGANESLYNDEFIVKKVNSLTSFDVNIGISTNSPATTGTIYVFRPIFTSQGGIVNDENENLGGRSVVEYAGITTTISADVLSATTTSIDIANIDKLDFKIGDYLQIDSEFVRIRTTPATSSVTGRPGVAANPLTVFRGVLGTKPDTHSIGAVVRKINPRAIEFRRNSIMRASGHTFEYVGFGPGNYSTALPDKQDRTISPAEELLSQSTKKSGGINVFTGMNNDGDFYIGNKKVSSATGQEEVFDSPVPSVVGEDVSSGGLNVGFDVLTPLEVSISRSLRVEGGPDANLVSEFDGPVIFNNKVTSTSAKGLEASSLFLQGDAVVSRKQTVGISTPSLAGNPGDITWNANPDNGGHLGWVYTRSNEWKRVGTISLEQNSVVSVFDKVGIATTSPGDCSLKVGSGTTLFCVDSNGVGIGTTANTFKLNVEGNVNISSNLNVSGIVTATSFVGDGNALTNLNVTASGWTNYVSGGSSITYNTYLGFVGVGTTAARYPLEVGAVGFGSTSLYVNGEAKFVGLVTTANLFVGGAVTATNYQFGGGTGQVSAGVVTTRVLNVGTGGTILSTTSGGLVGIGTTNPRDKLDIEGHTRFKTYSEVVEALSISSGVVTIDLSKAQTFTLDLNANVTQITVINPPTGSTAFTVKIAQDAIGGRTVVGLDTFKNQSGANIPVYWGAGGVVPGITTTANRADIYSFKTFDSGLSFYGVVGGQNFL
jgi:hypothetical protein